MRRYAVTVEVKAVRLDPERPGAPTEIAHSYLHIELSNVDDARLVANQITERAYEIRAATRVRP